MLSTRWENLDITLVIHLNSLSKENINKCVEIPSICVLIVGTAINLVNKKDLLQPLEPLAFGFNFKN